MVRVPGSSGDSGFHRESLGEDAKIKVEPGIEVSAIEGSSQTREYERSPDYQSFGRDFDDDETKEEDQAIDLEDKPLPPPQVPSGTLADRTVKRDPLDENPRFKTEGFSPTKTTKNKKKKSKAKLRAPGSDEGKNDMSTDHAGKKADRVSKNVDRDANIADRGSKNVDRDVKTANRETKVESWQLEQLEWSFHWKELKVLLAKDPVLKILQPKLIGSLRGPVSTPVQTTNKLEAIRRLIRLLQDAGFTPGAFDASTLLDCGHDQVVTAGRSLFEKLIPLTSSYESADQANVQIADMDKGYHTGSSHYASAESEVYSDESIKIERMSLGPAGAASLRERNNPIKIQSRSVDPPEMARVNPIGQGQLQLYFEAAMEKFVKDQQMKFVPTAQVGQATTSQDDNEQTPDIEMESAGSRHSRSNGYDPDDLGFEESRRPLVATAEAVTGGGLLTQRIRMSAITELKEFTGREKDVDRARSWISKVKSAFLRDQAPDTEKCLVFGDLLTGLARNWYAQLSRSTRNTWKPLLESFMVEYGGHGISVGRQYYHAWKRSDETPLEYLYRLNVAGMRAKIPVKDGSSTARREHVEHFIETLDNRDLAKQLTLLRLADADEMEDTLRTYQRMEARQGKALMGSSKFRQRSADTPVPALSKPARAVRAINIQGGSSESESDLSESDSEMNRRKIFVATTPDRAKNSSDHRTGWNSLEQTNIQDRTTSQKACTHCGSIKHSDRGCWKRLTCQKCGRKGHPSDKCFFVCAACGELHESGKCPMEEFYNIIRKWYVPTKHAGMLPPKAEEMLN